MTVTVSQAATILGIAKSTAHKNYKKTGYLLDGDLVPVLVCGSRTIVPIAHLREVLNYPSPAQPLTFGPSAVANALKARRLAEAPTIEKPAGSMSCGLLETVWFRR